MIKHNLIEENYYSPESNVKYMSASQFKDFLKCESMALAKLKKEYNEPKSTALLVGSYVDAHFEGTLDIFKAKNSEIFTLKGELKADYKKADKIIERIERDEMFSSFMSGTKQVIMIGEIAGIPFKIKIDSYFENEMIVDLKVIKDFERIWAGSLGKIPFVEFWGYDIQGAIYQEVVRQNTGKILPFYIAVATKEDEPNIEIMEIEQSRLDYCLGIVKDNAPDFEKIKSGLILPTKCGKCDHCKSIKVLEGIVNYKDVG